MWHLSWGLRVNSKGISGMTGNKNMSHFATLGVARSSPPLVSWPSPSCSLHCAFTVPPYTLKSAPVETINYVIPRSLVLLPVDPSSLSGSPLWLSALRAWAQSYFCTHGMGSISFFFVSMTPCLVPEAKFWLNTRGVQYNISEWKANMKQEIRLVTPC